MIHLPPSPFQVELFLTLNPAQFHYHPPPLVLQCLKLQFNPLRDHKNLDTSKLKQSADDNFKFQENSRKFSNQVENTVGKGEIARYEQFLLFPQCF